MTTARRNRLSGPNTIASSDIRQWHCHSNCNI